MTYLIYRERRKREDPPAKGRWKVLPSGLAVSCPRCGAPLHVFGSEIGPRGDVPRKIICRAPDCRFRDDLKLFEWGVVDPTPPNDEDPRVQRNRIIRRSRLSPGDTQ